MTSIWSSGGGTQSAAIAALIVRGDLPKPDLAAIVDTGWELSSTWDYHEDVIHQALRVVGVELVKVYAEQYRTVGLYSAKGDILIPAFTDDGGKLPTYCSTEWKQRPLRRWARERYPDADYFEVWLGISLDEARRVKPTDKPWLSRYPIIEKRLTRADCKALVESMGWPRPPRSSCYMCPNHTRAEWDAIWRERPNDWMRACAFEEDMRDQDDSLWLTATRKPLQDWSDDGQQDLYAGLCDSGYCFV